MPLTVVLGRGISGRRGFAEESRKDEAEHDESGRSKGIHLTSIAAERIAEGSLGAGISRSRKQAPSSPMLPRADDAVNPRLLADERWAEAVHETGATSRLENRKNRSKLLGRERIPEESKAADMRQETACAHGNASRACNCPGEP